jgi:long-chain acyl-CoA synthetase
MSRLLLTGATGFVGMEVLARQLERTDRGVIALVRAEDDDEAQARVDRVVADLFGRRARRYAGRVEAVAADLTAPGLGLGARAADALAEEVSDVIHAAASVSFALPLDESRAINVTGTERVLELAELAHERGGLRRFAYVSTAYVAGTHEGTFTEADLDVGQDFRNAYERSKLEAERIVHERGERLPVTILRPSIVVGDRRSGWTASFNVLYAPLRAFARGLYPAVPAVRSAPVDVVSIDYVADAIHSVCTGDDGVGETYHLTAGSDAATVGDLVDLATDYFARPLRVLDPEVFERDVEPEVRRSGSAAQRAVLERSRPYFPYFNMGVRFDDRRARSRLEPAGIRVAPLRDYFRRLVDHAVAARWGRRKISRAKAMSV